MKIGGLSLYTASNARRILLRLLELMVGRFLIVVNVGIVKLLILERRVLWQLNGELIGR